jgi:hypothetical protein
MHYRQVTVAMQENGPLYRTKNAGDEGASKYRPVSTIGAIPKGKFDGNRLAVSDQITSQGESENSDQAFEFQGKVWRPPMAAFSPPVQSPRRPRRSPSPFRRAKSVSCLLVSIIRSMFRSFWTGATAKTLWICSARKKAKAPPANSDFSFATAS